MEKFCIYHGNCADGFGAAWVVRKAFGKENVIFYPGAYQQEPPNVTGMEVVMVDFSYKRPVLLEMAKLAKSILIIDHHETAQADLIDLPKNVTTIFNMEHSGAMLTWLHYFPTVEPPQLLKHIEDRDLWQFKYPDTRNIQAALFSYPYDFELWDEFMSSVNNLPQLELEGSAIQRKHFKDINELIKSQMHLLTVQGHTVPALNAPYFYSSDAGHIMCQGFPFALCYWYGRDGMTFSLRSDKDTGINVANIAKHYGGGGHANAAGFSIKDMSML